MTLMIYLRFLHRMTYLDFVQEQFTVNETGKSPDITFEVRLTISIVPKSLNFDLLFIEIPATLKLFTEPSLNFNLDKFIKEL